MPYTLGSIEAAVAKTARVFMNNRSQAVRLPKEFQFSVSEVFIRKVGDEVILSPRPESWDEYLQSAPAAATDYMEGVEDLPLQERPSLLDETHAPKKRTGRRK